jgi:DNA polymerase-1
MKGYVGFDIETNQLSPFNEDSRILTAAMATADSTVTAEYEYLQDRRHAIHAIAAEPDNILVGHNIVSFDAVWWGWKFNPIRAKLFDTCVAWALIDENDKDNSLAGLSKKLLGKEANLEMKGKRANLEELPIEDVLAYNREDAQLSFELGNAVYHHLEDEGKWPLFAWIMDVSKPLIAMMVHGVQIDPDWIQSHASDLVKQAYELELEINRMVGRDDILINLDSPPQLRDLLFNELGMQTSVLTKTGQMSTSSAAIKEIQSRVQKEFPDVRDFLQLLLDYRKVKKLAKTYLVPYQEKHADTNDRVHTRYFLGKSYAGALHGGTVTGRLSSSEPNLQNIPRDYRVKGAFIPTTDNFPGHYPWSMFEVDYKQLEVRVAAWESQSPLMLDAINEGLDFHSYTLSLTSGMDYDEIVERLAAGDKKIKEDRTLAKRVVFGTLYGIGPFALQGLMRDMGIDITLHKAKKSIGDFFNAYPALKQWIDVTKLNILEDGYTTTPTGRVRHLPGATHSTGAGEKLLRQGVNFRIQSFASDITMLGLQNLDYALFTRMNQERLLLTVHDSIVGEYRNFPGRDHDELKEVIDFNLTDEVNTKLQDQFGIDRPVPLAVDTKMNMPRWGSQDD